MQILPRTAPLALGLCLAVSAAVAMEPASPFDGAYRGDMQVQPGGMSHDYTSPACQIQRPAEMSVRGGYAFLQYKDWHGHTLHYRGRIGADGTVNAYHRNGDGSSSVLNGNFSGNQFTGNMRRGRCDYSLALSRG